tara:strand:- start:2593 stop:3276 length:684 start_codon:yes stop_codon:yes gene_type:complete
MTQNKYLETIYNHENKPFSEYPKKLIQYLIKRGNLKKNQKILELGCGRGDFIFEFRNNGLDAYGCDISNFSQNFFPDLKFSKVDLEHNNLPYKNETFDIVYSKSFIEHFYYPEKIFQEAHRVLKPGGIIITLTPEWQYIYKSFYEDFTHRVPFTNESLKDIHLINNFKNVVVESFIQLPVLFEENAKSKLFYIASVLTRKLVPNSFRLKNKWIKFSKEVMLLSFAKK